jgi:hypothetical protein
MGRDPRPAGDSELDTRLEALGSQLGEREAVHRADLERARGCVERLRRGVESALERFHAAAAAAGAPHLRVRLSEIRPDDKHLRAVEFDLERGRHRAIVTAKARGDVTLVGPFHRGKTEGPCLSFPMDAEDDLRRALAEFLERFLEEAATP